jgi:shikimate kinase
MNIVLIGMPGCGKSTVGVLLAKSMLRDFVDTDLIIQNKYKKSLCDIINNEGLAAFKEKENTVLRDLEADNSVIATGGSAVYCPEGMENLKRNGKIIYLRLSPDTIKSRIKNITTRGIAMAPDCTIDDLYKERAVLYEKYADVIIDAERLSAEETVNKIVELTYIP